MYALWAQKPFNVQDPTAITFPDGPDPLAFMLQFFSLSSDGAYSGFKTAHPRTRVDCPMNAPMAFLKTIEPQCVHVSTSPGLPEILIDSVIEDEGQALARISRYYYISTKDNRGVYHYHPMGRPNSVYKPVSNGPVICALYSGQVLSFPGQVASSKIGPELRMLEFPQMPGFSYRNLLLRGIYEISMLYQ
jgi:hypothetical protein